MIDTIPSVDLKDESSFFINGVRSCTVIPEPVVITISLWWQALSSEEEKNPDRVVEQEQEQEQKQKETVGIINRKMQKVFIAGRRGRRRRKEA